MENKVIYYINSKEKTAFSTLCHVYNSQVHGNYLNKFYYNEKTKDKYCMIITLKGNFKTFHNNGKVDSVEENTIYFTRLKSIVKQESDSETWHAIFYWFDCKNISIPVNQSFKLQHLYKEREIDDATKIISLLKLQTDSKIIYANSLFHFKLCSFLEEVSVRSNKSLSIIDEMTSYINNHADNIKVTDLSNKFNYSEKHIYHLFKTNLNISPKQYITNVRMQKVCFLLQTTNMTLQNISDKMHFNSPAHLSNSFKLYYGYSPTVYRESYESLFFLDPKRKEKGN